MIEFFSRIIDPVFIVLLLISLATVLLFLASFFLPTWLIARFESSAKVVAAMTAIISLAVSAAGVILPLRPAAKDEAQSALEQYFESIKVRDFKIAYDILSDARKQEKRQELQMPNWGLKDFSDLFVGTRGSDNMKVEFLRISGGDRIYKASYDVYDDAPRSIIFANRKQLFSSKLFDGILNRENILNWVIDNLRQYYRVPDDSLPTIRSYIDNRTIESVLDPIFISVMVADLERGGLKLVAIPNPSRPDDDRIKRHFVHDTIVMIKEHGAWRIRSGLGASTIAVYP